MTTPETAASGIGRLVSALLAPSALELLHQMAVARMLSELRGFNQGLDVARRTFGAWDMRDPIEDMKHRHAGVVAFRSVFGFAEDRAADEECL